MRFTGTWRHYQELALAAFERDRATGHDRTHVVAPPGSGKTLVGLEICARLGRPALVLAPNSAVQAAWLRAARSFDGGAEAVATEPGAPIAVLTYQSLCRFEDPGALLSDLAEHRWTAERAAATGRPEVEVAKEAAEWSGEAARRRVRDLGRITAALKREIARAEHGDLHLGTLFSAPVRERIGALRAAGVGTVVLDECHHLASLWGYAVRAAVEELGDVHLVGLTATPPAELTAAEGDLYAALLGPVDFTVPTPAVVREGHLAPYQELAWLTRPLDGEARWLAEHDSRFRDLISALHEDVEGPLSFPGWVIRRLRERDRGAEDAQLSWGAFQRRHPRLARAGIRFLASGGLALPPGAPRGEGFREPPALEDWLVLLDDYALRCLAAHASPDATDRWESIAAALRDLGFTLTRRGIRRGRSDVDRLLTGSAAKGVALTEIVGAEYEARGAGLRALVLCDGERPRQLREDALVAVLSPDAGTAPEAVKALASDWRTGPLAPLLVSGRGLRCTPEHAGLLLDALAAAAGASESRGGWRAEPVDDEGLMRLVGGGGADWTPRRWVELATRAYAAGATQALVGTRALLGEGWDAPCVNVLVDLTVATTSVSVRQMRGRSLRLDPADPGKIASNWDVVCIAPELARGEADYERFVRKHAHLFAPSEDGALEAGPSHVHPALGPFAPPPDERFDAINAAMTARARDLDGARARWAVGTPYRGEEHATLVVRRRERTATVAQAPVPVRSAPRAPAPAAPLALAGAGAAVALVGALAVAPPLAAAALAIPAAYAWAHRRARRFRDSLSDVLPLEAVAQAIADAYVELGELSPAARLEIEPRADGYLRCALPDADPAAGERFARALDEALDPAGTPRYLVSRPAPPVRGGALRPRATPRWHPVPADLGRHRKRADAYHRAWTRHLGAGELRFVERGEEGLQLAGEAQAQAPQWETSARLVWR